MKSNIRKILILVTVIVSFASLTLNSFATTAPHANAQNKSNWCWAASSKLVGVNNGGNGLSTGATNLTNTSGLHSFGGTNYYGTNSAGDPTADTGQRQLLVHVKGNDQNLTGSNADRISAITRASNTTRIIGTRGGTSLSATDIANLKTDTSGSKWAVGNAFPSSGTGHCIVIRQYDSADKVFFCYDPWNNLTFYLWESTAFTSYVQIFSYSTTTYRINSTNFCN
jgi:hypothetical protein